MNDIRPIRPQSLPQMISDDLRRRILLNEIEAGAQLRQEALARYYDVSRMPVREALRRLEVEGLVQFLPHRGVIVNGLETEEISEYFHLRALLECDLMAAAVPRMTAEAIAEAEAHCATFDEMMQTHSQLDQWGALNWKLHSALYAPSGRRHSLQIVEALHGRCDRFTRLQLVLTEGEKRASDDHHRLIALARSGETATAVALLHRHIHDAGDALRRFLDARRAEAKAG